MKNYILSCCSTADLSAEHYETRDIKYICAETNTSHKNPSEFVKYFTPFLEAGLDILHVTLSCGLSGCCNLARVAKEELAERYPDRTIYIIDSLGVSSGYGLIMETLADKRDEGMDIDELAAWIKANKLKMQQWFLSTDLKTCPLLNVNYAGQFIPRARIRGKQKAIREIVGKMELLADDRLDYSGKCYISHSDCYKEAKTVADLVEKKFPKLNGKVQISSIGTAMGSHTGQGTVALFFWGDKRID